MDNNALIDQIKEYEDEYKTFMEIKDFPSYNIQTKVASAETAQNQGFESIACADYNTEANSHMLTVSNNLTLVKHVVFHEFTHILDSEIYVNGDKVRYMGISGFTEYHASQIELLNLLGAKSNSEILQFSMNDTIETLMGVKTVQQYIDEKQQHSIDLFGRKDFPASIDVLKSSVGIMFNYFGLRSICELYATDYNENINNQAYMKFISTQQFTAINNLMHGWLDGPRINLSILLYNSVIMSIIKGYRLI